MRETTMRRRIARRTRTPGLAVGLTLGLTVALAAGLAGCGGDARDVEDAREPGAGPVDTVDTAAAPAVNAEDVGPASSGMETVRVWFSRDEAPVAVERRVAGANPAAALAALMEGPTPEERAAGLWSWFSDSTRHALRDVRLEDGFLVVDFAGLPSLIPNASTSAGSRELLASLDSTTLQFPGVDSVEYRLDGSCDAFWEWLQRGCEVVRRPR